MSEPESDGPGQDRKAHAKPNRNGTYQSGTTTTTRRPHQQEAPRHERHASHQTTTRSNQTHTAHTAQPTHGDRPQFSLAGTGSYAPHGYVDPKYYDLNPSYQKEQEGPLWGLAKPLPRVVRRGMKGNQKHVKRNEGAERDAPGSSEAIPQVGMINEQREGEGKQSAGRVDRNGYGDQRRVSREGTRRTHSDHSTNDRSTVDNGTFEKYGTPDLERTDPINDWLSHTQSHKSHATGPPDDSSGDLSGGRLDRLSSIKEVSSDDAETLRRQDPNDYDLEANEDDDDWEEGKYDSDDYEEDGDMMHNKWSSIRAKFREPLAECLATMIAVLIGLATNLAAQTSNEKSGNYQSTNWAWGLGITVGIYIAGGISGAHLNPAISLMLCIFRGFPIRKAFVYMAAQVLGGFFAGLIAYGIYQDAITSFDAAGGASGGTQAVGLVAGGSGKSFLTGPETFVTASTAFFNEFVATAILSCSVLALGDDSNAPPGAGMHALIVGLIVTVLTMAFGYNTGGCFNPARDFGPRAATAMVGYGGEVFTMKNAWWIYGAWGATISGALVGAFFYDVAIFVGGESPVNYPRGKRKSAQVKAKKVAKRKWNFLAWGVGLSSKSNLEKDG